MANKVTLSTRECLLAAAEEIIVFRGVNALSVRKIGDAAGLNPTLVTYHFGSLFDLLDELCSLNLDPILGDWHQVDAHPAGSRSLDEVLHSWLGPMLRPACFTPGGRAFVVLDELAAHGEAALKDRVLRAMEAFALRLRVVLGPLLPHLAEDVLRARLRFISGAAMGPPPRVHVAMTGDGQRSLADLSYLLPFARAALEK
jgi:AcrR family transcriptional regulator